MTSHLYNHFVLWCLSFKRICKKRNNTSTGQTLLNYRIARIRDLRALQLQLVFSLQCGGMHAVTLLKGTLPQGFRRQSTTEETFRSRNFRRQSTVFEDVASVHSRSESSTNIVHGMTERPQSPRVVHKHSARYDRMSTVASSSPGQNKNSKCMTRDAKKKTRKTKPKRFQAKP